MYVAVPLLYTASATLWFLVYLGIYYIFLKMFLTLCDRRLLPQRLLYVKQQ